MKRHKTKFTNVLDTEMFGNDRRQYYFDIKKAKNNRRYLSITDRRQVADETYQRNQVILFEDDLGFFVEAISMLLGRFSHGQTGKSC